jgi:arginine N-succinyltransferase
MIIIRPIQKKDQNIFAEFSFESLLGMTNLTRNRDRFLEKIIQSETSFSKNITSPGDEEYYFVLEDMTTERIGGTCGIIADSAGSFSNYYQIKTIPIEAKQVATPEKVQILQICNNTKDASEICALYLQHTFRHSGQGRLLSLSRFLFMAAFPQRFRKNIVAELRGYIDQRQISPFWEGIGRHFCHLSFVELMAQIDIDRTFIPEILPAYPIYVMLLPKETQESIGKMHDSTTPAYHMLVKENFTYNEEIDIFEGGPIISAKTNEIRSIAKSCVKKVRITTDPLPNENEYILGNERIDFRACFGKMQSLPDDKVLIHQEVAHALQIKENELIRYVNIH